MSIRSEGVKRWRENTKRRMIEAMGGKCCICGYNKCFKSMDFHHLDPSEKEISFGAIMAHPISWDRIIIELRKCVCLCSNCHGEVHDSMIKIPDNALRFNESYVQKGKSEMSPCPICGTLKPTYSITCSRQCASSKNNITDWSKVDVLKLKEEGLSNDAIGTMVGVTGGSVKKRIKVLLRNINMACAYCKSPMKGSHGNQRYCSERCARFASRKVIRPSKEQLAQEISTIPMTVIGEKYGVSDNAVRKWAKSYGIIV